MTLLKEAQPTGGVSATFLGKELQGGRYLIEEKVSQGGSAWLFRARHTTLDEAMAIKILYPQFLEDETIRQRFLEEARIQFRLRHQNIVHITDVINEPHCLGSVMEWIAGEDLQAYIRRVEGPKPLSDIETLILPIIRALHFVHQAGVVHRDIKPANILLQQTQHGMLPKLTDFGIAKVLFAEGNTMTGSALGTVTYMAPEQINDAKQVTPQADIYSLGVLLFQMLTGQTPFQGSPQQQLVKHLSQAPPGPRAIFSGISQELERIVLWCLEKQPEDRPDNCGVLLLALHDALKIDVRATLTQLPGLPVGLPTVDTTTLQPAIEPPGQLPEPGLNTDLELVLDQILEHQEELTKGNGAAGVGEANGEDEDLPTTVIPTGVPLSARVATVVPAASRAQVGYRAPQTPEPKTGARPSSADANVFGDLLPESASEKQSASQRELHRWKLAKATSPQASGRQVGPVISAPRSILLDAQGAATSKPNARRPASVPGQRSFWESAWVSVLVRLFVVMLVLGGASLVWKQFAPSATIVIHDQSPARSRQRHLRGGGKSLKSAVQQEARVCFDITPADTSFHFKLGQAKKRFRRGSFCLSMRKKQPLILWRYGFHGCEFEVPMRETTHVLQMKAKHVKLASDALDYCIAK